MRYIGAFGRFWYGFVVGDDWLVAVGIVAALGLTAILAHHDVNAWWMMPPAVVAVLLVAVRRAARRH